MYSPTYIWASLLRHLEERFPNAVDTYFSEAELVALTEEYLILQVESAEGREAIRQQFKDFIEEVLAERFYRKARLLLPDAEQLQAYRERESDAEPAMLSPEFTFETFLAGPENEMALKVAKAIAADPGTELYNPLYLYGPAGVGKTHLLHAIGNRIRQTFPNKRIFYVRGETLYSELIDAVSRGKFEGFRRRYRLEPDVFMLDGISVFGGREGAQEELFNILSDLQSRRKMLIFTAEKKPSELFSFAERLIDRFSGGIVEAVSLPSFDTRLWLIREKARLLDLELDADTIRYLACNLTESVRQIEGTLKKLRLYRDLQGVPMDLPHVAQTVEL